MDFTSHKKTYLFQTAAKTDKKELRNVSPTHLKSKISVIRESNLSDAPSSNVQRELAIEQLKYQKKYRYNKENFISSDEFELLANEHRIETEKLLLEITRLHDIIYEVQKSKKYEIQKIKDEYQHINYLKLSNLKQSQFNQVEILESQLRKIKEILLEKTQECQQFENNLKRQKESHEKDIERYQNQIKQIIEKKNNEIDELEKVVDGKSHKLEKEAQDKINEIKYLCDKEISNLTKNLQQKEKDIAKIHSKSDNTQQEYKKTLQNLQNEREKLKEKLQERMREQNERYEKLREGLNEVVSASTQNQDLALQNMRKIFAKQYQKLEDLIKLKDNQNTRTQVYYEALKIEYKTEIAQLANENEDLRKALRDERNKAMQELQLLKVKMAALHESSLKELVHLYEVKIEGLVKSQEASNQQCAKMRQYLHQEAARKFQTKKKYQTAISELNSKILKLRLGLSAMESDFKDKLENQKSLMLMTSRSFIKDAEVKNNNVKFYQEQLRKLRQLLDLQAKQMESSEKNVEEKIKAAQNELERLSNKIIQIKKENQINQDAFREKIKSKDEQIAHLREELEKIKFPEFDNSAQMKLIDDLKEDAHKKLQQNAVLKDKIAYLESRMKEMRAQLERYQIQNSINQEEAKKHYKIISEENLHEFKLFYEDKLQTLEDDKADLKRLISSQYEQITELLKKYKELEEGLKDAVALLKKRGDLQERVLSLGLDNNLVKNIAQLLPQGRQF